jgi:HEAT repeat protein
MIGRLETEDQVAVRAPLYNAIAVMGGESSLNVFRAFLKTGNQFDQAVVVDSIGRIGSPKGLNVLRALLPDENPNTVAHALGAIAAIGGEGALDTIFAATSDRRRSVSSGAAELLTDLRDARVAPRRAGELLEIVREPVGNLSMRARIVELTEALVTLAYTEPIDDLKAAIGVQSDLEILDSLTSCVRRLELMKAHGDNDAAWAAELASPIVSVRALADRRLAELGTPAALRALTARLAQADLPADERADLLRAIGDAKTAGAAPLVERNLAEPVYDAWELHDARTAAAYAARRLGGTRMSDALRASAVRRDGRDWATLVYLAVLEKGAALDTLKTLKVRRMRYPESPRGKEDVKLSGIIADLSSGHAPVKFDVTPDGLFEP